MKDSIKKRVMELVDLWNKENKKAVFIQSKRTDKENKKAFFASLDKIGMTEDTIKIIKHLYGRRIRNTSQT